MYVVVSPMHTPVVCVRVLTIRLYTGCRCDVPFLYSAIDVMHTYIIFMHKIHTNMYTHAYSYIDERTTDACLHHLHARVCVSVFARACACKP